jgi:serine/threonine protein kinase
MSSGDKSGELLQERYSLRKMIGEGAYSFVFKGLDIIENCPVAVKKLKTANLSFEEKEEVKGCFLREVDFLKSLQHPAIPKFYDFIYESNRFYLIMEYIDGEDLLSILAREGPFTENRAYRIMVIIADALLHLQNRNTPIIYKDLKPSNIMETKEGKVKLIDFGTARFFSDKKGLDTNILGTPGYAPPEAYGKASTNLSADVYSFGATFFHLLTAEEPVQFKFRFPSPTRYNPDLSYLFCRIIQDCLKKKEHRIADAKELTERLAKADPIYEVRWLQSRVANFIKHLTGDK